MADRGRKSYPVTSKVCDERWVAHCQKLHKERLDNMKKRIDNTEPECNTLNIDKFNNPKRKMLDSERQTEIDLENRILLEKMVKIKNFDSTTVFKPWLGRTTFQWRPGYYYDAASNTKCVDHVNQTCFTSPNSVHHASKVTGAPSYKETQKYLGLLQENSKLLKAIDHTRSEYSLEKPSGWTGVAVEGARELRWGGLQQQHVTNASYVGQQSTYRGPEWARYAPPGSPTRERSMRPGSAGTDPLGSRYTGAFDRPILQRRAAASAGPMRSQSAPRPPPRIASSPREEDANSGYGWSEASGNTPQKEAAGSPMPLSSHSKPPGLPKSGAKTSGRPQDLDASSPTKASSVADGEHAPSSPSGSVRSTGSRKSGSGSGRGSASSPYLQSVLEQQARQASRPGSAAASPRPSAQGSRAVSARGSRPPSATGSVSAAVLAMAASDVTPSATASKTPSAAPSRPASRDPSVAGEPSKAGSVAPPAGVVDPGMSFGNDALDAIIGMENMEHEDLSKSAAFPPASVIGADEEEASQGGATEGEEAAEAEGEGAAEAEAEGAAEAEAEGAAEAEAEGAAEDEAEASQEGATEAEEAAEDEVEASLGRVTEAEEAAEDEAVASQEGASEAEDAAGTEDEASQGDTTEAEHAAEAETSPAEAAEIEASEGGAAEAEEAAEAEAEAEASQEGALEADEHGVEAEADGADEEAEDKGVEEAEEEGEEEEEEEQAADGDASNADDLLAAAAAFGDDDDDDDLAEAAAGLGTLSTSDD